MEGKRTNLKALVIYDSKFGNTERVAKAIARAAPQAGEVKALHVGKARPADLVGLKLLIVGSPTHGGRPTPAIQEFIASLPVNTLKDISVAAFDTRFAAKDHGFGLRLVMKTIGFAAGRIAKALQAKGGQLKSLPEGFIVDDTEGPIRHGELDRAATWARSILQSSP